MDSNKSTTGTEKPADLPSEPKQDNNHDMLKKSAPGFQQMKRTKPGTESARKDVNASIQESTTSRETTPSPKKPNTNAGKPGHKKTDSNCSDASMKVSSSVSDRGDDSEHKSSPQPPESSATEKKNDINGIGGIF